MQKNKCLAGFQSGICLDWWLFLSLTFGGKKVYNCLTPPGSFLHCREFFSFCLRGHFFSSGISFLPGPPRLYIVWHVSCLCTHTHTHRHSLTHLPPLAFTRPRERIFAHSIMCVCVCWGAHRVDCASRDGAGAAAQRRRRPLIWQMPAARSHGAYVWQSRKTRVDTCSEIQVSRVHHHKEGSVSAGVPCHRKCWHLVRSDKPAVTDLTGFAIKRK